MHNFTSKSHITTGVGLSLLLLTFLFSAASGQVNRWSVKTLTDGFTYSGKPKIVTVKEMEALPIIKVNPKTARLLREKEFIEITGKIAKYQKEADGDIHVEISDGTCKDSTIACEFVDPKNSKAKKSPYYDNFVKVRDFISKKKVGDTVTISGVAFQDQYHNPSPHRIRNMMEIHAVTETR